ncbi:MAG TPA: AraC family transcriptional regulator [bacterium]|nr:AraC family transcriptional regulator [bacterium]
MKRPRIDLRTGTASEAATPPWLSRVLSNNAVINLFTDYVSLPCYVVDRRQPDLWYTLAAPSGDPSPFQFELYFGKKADRLRYNHDCFEKAAHLKKGVLEQHSGLWDYFAPVLQNGKCVAYVVSGSFQRTIPSFEALSKQFSLLAGKAPGLADPIFNDYARILLQTSLISDQALPDYRKLIDALAKFVAEERPDPGFLGQVEKMKAQVFSQHMANRMWHYSQVKRNRLLWGPWQGSELAPWDRDEFHLTRHPNTVLAVMLGREGAVATSEVRSMVQSAQMQWACFEMVRQLPETVCGKMENQGAFFLTSTDPKRNAAQARLQVRDMAMAIEEQLRKKFKTSVFVGISRLDHATEELPEAFQESTLALHLGLHHQKSQVFYQDQYEAKPENTEFTVLHWAVKLVEACGRAEEKEIRLMREEYVREALRASAEKAEVLRVHLIQLLFMLMETVQKRALVVEPQFTTLSKELSEKYTGALTSAELLGLFRSHLEFFSNLFQSPLRGERNFRLERAKDYIAQNFQRSLSLTEVASRTGFSVSRFSRCFKESFGMGFSDYLLQLRCDHARRLLETTRLSIGQIAQDCGFQSASYFIQQFKRRSGQTPQAFRQQKG